VLVVAAPIENARAARHEIALARPSSIRDHLVGFAVQGDVMAKSTRTTHRSTAGKKLYAVRDSKGRFKDIQTYERAHRADLAKTSKAEPAQRAKRAAAKKAR
jgi:hypothetical protein